MTIPHPGRTPAQRRVLVCGGRNYNDYVTVYDTLTMLDDDEPIGTVIAGGASGADYWAESWADIRSREMLIFRAEWKRHGRRAGPLRNQRMLDEGKPDMVVAFPGGRGTADMCRKAEAAGVPLFRVDYVHREKYGPPKMIERSGRPIDS